MIHFDIKIKSLSIPLKAVLKEDAVIDIQLHNALAKLFWSLEDRKTPL
jgi:hypothetical protein